MWIKCTNSEWYEKKFTEKLYLLRTIIDKLIRSGIRARRYIEEYFMEMEKYERYLSEKIIKSRDLIIYLYEME